MALVLIVDDEVSITEMLMELVEDAGHTAMATYNGSDALVLARQHQPSLIISDVRMPILDGYGLLAGLRADVALAHTMVILMSAHATAAEMFRSQATAFTPKPLDLGVIEQFLQHLP